MVTFSVLPLIGGLRAHIVNAAKTSEFLEEFVKILSFSSASSAYSSSSSDDGDDGDVEGKLSLQAQLSAAMLPYMEHTK